MNELPIVMMSCDPYADLWDAAHVMWRKMWPDCPGRLFWVSNEHGMHADGVTPIVTWHDPADWCGNLRMALDRIGEPHVLLVLDDLWMSRPVDTRGFHEALYAFRAGGWDGLRFMADWEDKGKCCDGLRARLPNTAPYRVSSIIGLWKTDVLHAIARPGWSIWDFEVRGTLAVEPLPLDLRVQRPGVLRYDNTVVRGGWTEYGHGLVGQHCLPVDFSARGMSKDDPPTVKDWVYSYAPEVVLSALRKYRVRKEWDTTVAIMGELGI